MAVGLLIITTAVCSMVVVPGLFIEDIDVNAHVATLSTIPYIIYAIFFMVSYLALIGLTLRTCLVALRNNRKKASSFGLYLVGWLVMGIVGTIFNLFLPLFGNYELIWIGPLGLFMMVPMAFRVATTDEHFSAIRTFVRGLLYTLFGALSVFATFFVTQIVSGPLEFAERSDPERFAIVALALIFLIPTIFLLFWLMRSAVRRLDSDGYDEAEVLKSMSQIASEKHGLVDFFRSVRHTLDKAFGVEFVDIVIFDQETAVHVDGGKLENELRSLVVNRSRGGSIYREDVRNKLIYEALVAHNIEVVTPIIGVMDNKVVGVIVLSPRKRRFDRYYGETLVKVSAVLSPFIQSAVFYEQISEFNARLKHQVREKTQELRESNKELMKLDDMKDDLLSIASHNLRTPLTGIIGYADMLREGDFGKVKPEQAAVLGEMIKSGKNMAQILADFLDVTRISSGRLSLKKEQIDFVGLVAEEIVNLREIATKYGRELVFQHDAGKIEVIGDELHLRQAVVNLIDNAIYYGKKKIEVSLRKDGERVVFVVSDDGMGVPKGDQSKLFTKMFRASNATAIRPDGSGIGLFVIKNVVEESGGKIIFESTEGKGSKFGFEI